jgi:RsiW-degrading membrane proteinase PrsW (M82 family)
MNLIRQPAYWLFVVLVMAGFGIVGFEQLTYLTTYPAAWFLSILLLAAVAIPVGLIIYRLDQFEPEPATLIAAALLWGGVVALSFAAVANSWLLTFLQQFLSPDQLDSWGAAIVAPINEEFYKGAGLVMIFFMVRNEIDSLMDGLVYGAMIGLGFQVVENTQYFVHAAAQSGAGQIGPVISTFFVRVLLAGLYSHMLFTGLLGFGFAYFVTRRSAPMRTRAAVLCLFVVLAWAAHFVWNSPWLDSLLGQSAGTSILVLVTKGLPFLILLLLLGIFARRREGQAFTRLMEEEVGSEIVTEAEFEVLRSGRRRRAALRRMKREKGPAARRLLKRLHREQMNLALFHSKVDTSGHPAVEVQRGKIRQLKAQLAAVGELWRAAIRPMRGPALVACDRIGLRALVPPGPARCTC